MRPVEIVVDIRDRIAVGSEVVVEILVGVIFLEGRDADTVLANLEFVRFFESSAVVAEEQRLERVNVVRVVSVAHIRHLPRVVEIGAAVEPGEMPKPVVWHREVGGGGGGY